MLSRVAEGMFWLNRYMERTERILLTLNTFYILSFDNEMGDLQGFRPLLKHYTNLSEKQIHEVQFDSNFVIKYILCDNLNENSVKNLVIKARENARGAQDRITKELWEHINYLYHYINSSEYYQKLETYDSLSIVTRLNKDFLLYNGILHATMPRGIGWYFFGIGRYIERCLQTLSMAQIYYDLIDYNLDGSEDLLYWRKLLLLLSGYELYLKSYSNLPHNRKVAEEVIFNRGFAHSVIYTLELIDINLNNLLKEHNLNERKTLIYQFGRLKSQIEFTDYRQLTNQQFKDLLNNTKTQLLQFSTDFSNLFFSYT